MEKSRLILLAVRLEQQAAECYKKLSRLAASQGFVAEELEKLSREEIVHANLLRSSEKYVSADPHAFENAELTEADLAAYLDLAERFARELEGTKLTLAEGLAVIRDLEVVWEKAHIGTLLKITDSSLKQLFQALSAGEKDHSRRLEKVLETLRIKPASRS